jgi:hypothetical protein
MHHELSTHALRNLEWSSEAWQREKRGNANFPTFATAPKRARQTWSNSRIRKRLQTQTGVSVNWGAIG